MLNKDVGKKWLQRGGVLPFLSNIFELGSENYGIYMYPHEFVHTGLQNIELSMIFGNTSRFLLQCYFLFALPKLLWKRRIWTRKHEESESHAKKGRGENISSKKKSHLLGIARLCASFLFPPTKFHRTLFATCTQNIFYIDQEYC